MGQICKLERCFLNVRGRFPNESCNVILFVFVFPRASSKHSVCVCVFPRCHCSSVACECDLFDVFIFPSGGRLPSRLPSRSALSVVSSSFSAVIRASNRCVLSFCPPCRSVWLQFGGKVGQASPRMSTSPRMPRMVA